MAIDNVIRLFAVDKPALPSVVPHTDIMSFIHSFGEDIVKSRAVGIAEYHTVGEGGVIVVELLFLGGKVVIDKLHTSVSRYRGDVRGILEIEFSVIAVFLNLYLRNIEIKAGVGTGEIGRASCRERVSLCV